jgi:hypothetical protein
MLCQPAEALLRRGHCRRRSRDARLTALRADLVQLADLQELDQSTIGRAGPVLASGTFGPGTTLRGSDRAAPIAIVQNATAIRGGRVMNSTSSLNGSSVWVRPAGAGLACGRGRAAGSGSPFGSGSVRSWAGGSSGSRTGWVTSTWSGFAFLRLRTAAVRGRAPRPPAGLGLVGCVRAEAVVGSSTGPTSPAAAVVSDGDRTDRAVRAVRAVRGGRGVGSSAAGLGVSAVVVELEPRRRAHDGAPRRSGAPLTPRDGDDADMLRSAADGGTRRVSRCRGCPVTSRRPLRADSA